MIILFRCFIFILYPLTLLFGSLCFADVLDKKTSDLIIPEFHNTKLANGLQLVVLPDHKVPVINAMLVYKVGGIDDPLGKSGLAHFLEHLMFRETKNYPDVVSILEENNSVYNAFTGQYITAYHHKFTSNRLADILKLEADRMVNLTINSNSESAEKKIVLEERNSGLRHPRNRLFNQMMSAFYINNKGWNVIGWEQEISKLNRSDANDFYKNHYSPENAILVLTGDVKPDKASILVKKYFGNIKPMKAKVLSRHFLQEPEFSGDVYVHYMQEEVKRPELAMIFMLPALVPISTTTAQNYKKLVRDMVATDMAKSFLGGTNGFGHLFIKVVLEQEVADDVSIDTIKSHDRSVLLISAIPKPGVTLDKLESSIRSVLLKIADNGISKEDFALLKQYMNYTLARLKEDPGEVQFFYGNYLGYGLPIEEVNTIWNMHEKIDMEEVNTLISRSLKSNSVVGYLQPKEAR